MTSGEHDREVLMEELEDAIELVRAVEWGGGQVSSVGYSGPVCPVCRASPRDGHSRKGCKLNEFLRRHE